MLQNTMQPLKAISLKNSNSMGNISYYQKEGCGGRDRDRGLGCRARSDNGRAEENRIWTVAPSICGMVSQGWGVGYCLECWGENRQTPPRTCLFAHLLSWLMLVSYSSEFCHSEKRVGEIMNRWRPHALCSDQGKYSLLTNCHTWLFLGFFVCFFF